MKERNETEGSNSSAAGRKPTAKEAAESRSAIFEAAGSWKDVDVEAVKAYLAERRRIANRPSITLQIESD